MEEEATPTDAGGERSEQPQATKPHETEEPSSSPEASAEAEEPENQGNKGAGNGPFMGGDGSGNAGMFRIYAAVFIIVAALLIIVIRRILYPRMQRAGYDKQLCSLTDDSNAFIRVRTGRFLFFLKQCGIRVPDWRGESQWVKKTADLCGSAFDQKTWERIEEILQKAEYAADCVTQEEFKFYCNTVKKAERILFKNLRKGRRRHLWILGLKN